MTNQEVFEIYQKVLVKKGLHAKDVRWLDGYFIFEMGEDAVVHFRIKELKGWLFGIWFGQNIDPENYIDRLFWQYEKDIDKFKPTRSHFVVDIPVSVRKTMGEDFWEYDAELDELLTITHYTALARHIDNSFGTYASKKKIRKDMIKDMIKNALRAMVNNFMGDRVSKPFGKGFTISVGGKPYPFKFIYILLRYGRKAGWNHIF